MALMISTWFRDYFFALRIGDKEFNLSADIKQAIGSDFEKGSIEISRPKGYDGPFNYGCFRTAAEEYYRSLVGSNARVINIQGGAPVKIKNSIIIQEMSFECDMDEGSAGW
jgi:hypothetical protein